MSRLLVVYATREGQTEKIARRICQHLEEAGATAQAVNAADRAQTASLELTSFDRVVLGASMHAGGLEKELVEFINSHAGELQPMPRSFFLVLLSVATKDAELRAQWLADARKKMDEQLDVEFDDVEMIAGALTYSKYSLPMKWVMRRIAGKAGGDTDTSRDYEYTDWQQVERYAERLMKA